MALAASSRDRPTACAWLAACPVVSSWTSPNAASPVATASTAVPACRRVRRPVRLAATYSRCPWVGEIDPVAGAVLRNPSKAFRSPPRSSWLRGRPEPRQSASRSSNRACSAAMPRSLSRASTRLARPVWKAASSSNRTQLAASRPAGTDDPGTSRRTSGITCLFRLLANSSSIRHILESTELGEMTKMNLPLRRMAASSSGQNGAAGRMAWPSWSHAMSCPAARSAAIKASANVRSSRAYDTNAAGIAVPPPEHSAVPATALPGRRLPNPAASRAARSGE